MPDQLMCGCLKGRADIVQGKVRTAAEKCIRVRDAGCELRCGAEEPCYGWKICEKMHLLH